MKTSNSSVGKAGQGSIGLILLSVAVGAGSARAETFQHGGSTATIAQSGGDTSRSEVTRCGDGQKIVTQDGNSTDITIQGGILEQHWNGAKLVDSETMLAWAGSMTWKGLHPIVQLSKDIHEKGISLTKKAMKADHNPS
jgi:hypothetical protein